MSFLWLKLDPRTRTSHENEAHHLLEMNENPDFVSNAFELNQADQQGA